jgi:hypothetical protein
MKPSSGHNDFLEGNTKHHPAGVTRKLHDT